MSFTNEKLTIMIRKKLMRISPSIRLKATEGRTGRRYVRTPRHVFVDHVSSASTRGTPVEDTTAGAWVVSLLLTAVVAGVAHPAAIKSALVSSRGAATKIRTLKNSAKQIEPAAAGAEPRFSSSFARFGVGTGNKHGTPP